MGGNVNTNDPISTAVEQVRYMRRRGMTPHQAAAAIGLMPLADGGWDAVTWAYAEIAYRMNASQEFSK
jgi:hypothetical protein